MTDEVVYIEDPVGNRISLAKKLCCIGDEEMGENDLYDDLYSVIKKPALLIQTDVPSELNYYRSIGWQFSVLIKAKWNINNWEAYQCIINPSDNDIVALMKTGKQII